MNNYGNRVKQALEEWRHWLEDVEQPFFVWIDHKNFEYIRSAVPSCVIRPVLQLVPLLPPATRGVGLLL